jgi:hypothetical protein
MSDVYPMAPVQLTDVELDAVAGGQPDQSGLVNVGNVGVAIPVTASVGVLANVLGLQRDANLDSVANQQGVEQRGRF